MLAAHCAKARGAARVVMIDSEQDRLDFVKKHVPGTETINFKEKKITQALKELFPHGPDVCIEAVGCVWLQGHTAGNCYRLRRVADGVPAAAASAALRCTLGPCTAILAPAERPPVRIHPCACAAPSFLSP